jgi:hypothetical protein
VNRRRIACLQLASKALDLLVENQPQLSQDLAYFRFVAGGKSLGTQTRDLIFKPHECKSRIEQSKI